MLESILSTHHSMQHTQKTIKIIKTTKHCKTMTFLNSRYKNQFPNSQFRFHDFYNDPLAVYSTDGQRSPRDDSVTQSVHS